MRNLSIFRAVTFMFLGFHSLFCVAQEQEQPKAKLNFSGFVDAFYAYDFNEPEGARQPFVFNHNRHNSFNLNLGLLQAEVQHEKYRAVLALQGGTYAEDNYAEEEGMLRNIFEAYAGVSLNKQNTLWLDAGIFSSHLGFESAISEANWALSRSLCAENSPYFLSGAKLTYTPNEKWLFLAVLTNGWQRIRRVEGNSLMSWGTQVQFMPSEKATLNWSTFVGTEDPDDLHRMRYFNNLYGQFQLGKLGLIVGFDFGLQQKEKGSSEYDNWFTPIVIAQLPLHEKWAVAVRAEHFQDSEGLIVSTGTPNGFQTTGLSANIDFRPQPKVALRIEGRSFSSRDAIFTKGNEQVTGNFTFLTSLAVRF